MSSLTPQQTMRSSTFDLHTNLSPKSDAQRLILGMEQDKLVLFTIWKHTSSVQLELKAQLVHNREKYHKKEKIKLNDTIRLNGQMKQDRKGVFP